jgi:hypothetical protein
MRYEPAEPAGPGAGIWGHAGRAVTVVGTRSPLEVAVCRALSAGGYRLASMGSDAPVLVVAGELALPAGWLVSRCRRWRAAWRRDQFVAVARLARERGVTRLVALSSALVSGRSSGPGSGRLRRGDVPPEIAQALAAEAAAESFAGLGGAAVVLRLGWTYGETDRLTRQILAAAARGWLLLDGPPEARVPTVEISDAARAAAAALTAPAGTYYVTDGSPRALRELACAIAAAAGRELHPLDDGAWGHGQLFRYSRPADGAEFQAVTGWRPRFPDPAEQLSQLCQAASPARPQGFGIPWR